MLRNSDPLLPITQGPSLAQKRPRTTGSSGVCAPIPTAFWNCHFTQHESLCASIGFELSASCLPFKITGHLGAVSCRRKANDGLVCHRVEIACRTPQALQSRGLPRVCFPPGLAPDFNLAPKIVSLHTVWFLQCPTQAFALVPTLKRTLTRMSVRKTNAQPTWRSKTTLCFCYIIAEFRVI